MDSTRQAYTEKVEATLREWNARIELFLARADKAKAEGKIRFQSRLDDLREKREAARQKLDELQESTGEAWKEIRPHLDRATGELKAALDRAFAAFGGEDGPAPSGEGADREADTAPETTVEAEGERLTRH